MLHVAGTQCGVRCNVRAALSRVSCLFVECMLWLTRAVCVLLTSSEEEASLIPRVNERVAPAVKPLHELYLPPMREQVSACHWRREHTESTLTVTLHRTLVC